MQFKAKTLLFTSLLAFMFFGNTAIYAQGVKIDGVAVVIGKNIVLDSDIDKFKQEIELRSEGKVKISNCEMLEQLMEQKLLSHHAVIDSVTVSQAEIDSRVNRSVQFFTQEYGNIDKVVAAYGFNDISDLRKELEKVQKENILIEKEEGKITEKIDVTPEEVRIYYNGLKEKNELPEFPAEISIAQLVVYAKAEESQKNKVINKLNEIKKEVEEGSSFKLKAIVNSEDPSVSQNGGALGAMTKDSPFIKEFKEVAFSLDLNQVSEPFETIFGYHIVLVTAIKGNTREVSHILMRPEIPQSKLDDTKKKVEDIRIQINEGKMTFEEAVKEFSEDKETKNNNGLIINGYTGETTFDLTRMDPATYARVNSLKKDEMTDVFYDETRGGEKMYKFMIMKERTDTHKADIVDDYVKIQKLALQKKKEETITNWSKEKIKDTYIKLSSDYKKCTFQQDWKKENK